ncbi:MAG: hypothetical protein JW801_07235 [Bacteroidales bacterium]|nr:hypothetical protein [Bacteroidales bacterium]
MKKMLIILLLFQPLFQVTAQRDAFNLSPDLQITPLSERTYLHTFDNSNGIVFSDQDVALIVSTPPSDSATDLLIHWVRDSLHKEIIAWVIDRWHPDAMEGLDVVMKHNIPSFAYEQTRQIAKAKGLPVPETGFDPVLEIAVGNSLIHCEYFGPAHTRDGIVVYLPDEKILFGGNEVRNFNGWIGNIADASLSDWSATILKVKNAFPGAEIIIPGHGAPGRPELLDYTIQLYAPFKTTVEAADSLADFHRKLPADQEVFILQGTDTLMNNQAALLHARLYLKRKDRAFLIESPCIQNPHAGSYRSDEGTLKLIQFSDADPPTIVEGHYQSLFCDIQEDVIEMTLILRTFLPLKEDALFTP